MYRNHEQRDFARQLRNGATEAEKRDSGISSVRASWVSRDSARPEGRRSGGSTPSPALPSRGREPDRRNILIETDQWTGAEALSAIETVTSRNHMTVLHQRAQVVRPRYVDCR